MAWCSGGRCWGVGKWKRVGSEPLAVGSEMEDGRPGSVGSEQPFDEAQGQWAVGSGVEDGRPETEDGRPKSYSQDLPSRP